VLGCLCLALLSTAAAPRATLQPGRSVDGRPIEAIRSATRTNVRAVLAAARAA